MGVFRPLSAWFSVMSPRQSCCLRDRVLLVTERSLPARERSLATDGDGKGGVKGSDACTKERLGHVDLLLSNIDLDRRSRLEEFAHLGQAFHRQEKTPMDGIQPLFLRSTQYRTVML